jgi:hypothetical protein
MKKDMQEKNLTKAEIKSLRERDDIENTYDIRGWKIVEAKEYKKLKDTRQTEIPPKGEQDQ